MGVFLFFWLVVMVGGTVNPPWSNTFVNVTSNLLLFPVSDSTLFYWNVWETLPPAATNSKQVSSLKPREWAKPWVCSSGWQVNVTKVICDLLSCYTVSLGVSLWQGLMSDNLALRFPLLRAVPGKSSLSGLEVLELEKTKGSCWQGSTKKI